MLYQTFDILVDKAGARAVPGKERALEQKGAWDNRNVASTNKDMKGRQATSVPETSESHHALPRSRFSSRARARTQRRPPSRPPSDDNLDVQPRLFMPGPYRVAP